MPWKFNSIIYRRSLDMRINNTNEIHVNTKLSSAEIIIVIPVNDNDVILYYSIYPGFNEDLWNILLISLIILL